MLGDRRIDGIAGALGQIRVEEAFFLKVTRT
jgi:hypothetical protein